MVLSVTKQDLEDLQKAGHIAAQALQYGTKQVKKEVPLLEVTEKVEQKIDQLGGQLAFPVNMSCDTTAAHYAATPDDKTVLRNQLLKLDVGVNINGFIGDNALTIDLSGEHADLVKASRDALNNVIKLIKPGVTLHEIGATAEETITDMGFQPIRNLSGHEIGKYIVHTGLSIPSYASGEMVPLEEGMMIAIEPFATTGIGLTKEDGQPEIFSITRYKPQRVGFVRDMVSYLEDRFKFMPFSRRALLGKFTLPQVNYTLALLKTQGMLRHYPPLVEKAGGLVSQAEHSMYIEKNKARVLTTTDD
ncbi:type II methionyl aminopeptidase [Candidatus Woesearchaeota archaeon]|nr:type II methionyl aminopeptidase [Candidatus Woesearchaeota archaeon]